MIAVYGLLVMAASILLFTCAVLAFRRPSPPRWTTLPTMETTVTIVFTAAVAFGFGFFAKYFLAPKVQSFGTVEIAATTAILVGFVVCWRIMKPGKRLAAYEAEERAARLATRVDTAAKTGTAANDLGKVIPIASGNSRHKAG